MMDTSGAAPSTCIYDELFAATPLGATAISKCPDGDSTYRPRLRDGHLANNWLPSRRQNKKFASGAQARAFFPRKPAQRTGERDSLSGDGVHAAAPNCNALRASLRRARFQVLARTLDVFHMIRALRHRKAGPARRFAARKENRIMFIRLLLDIYKRLEVTMLVANGAAGESASGKYHGRCRSRSLATLTGGDGWRKFRCLPSGSARRCLAVPRQRQCGPWDPIRCSGNRMPGSQSSSSTSGGGST